MAFAGLPVNVSQIEQYLRVGEHTSRIPAYPFLRVGSVCSWAASCNRAMRCRQIACPARVCSAEWSGSLRTTLERRRAALRWGFNERSRTTRLPSRGGSSSLNSGSDSEMLCMSVALCPNFLSELFVQAFYPGSLRDWFSSNSKLMIL